MEVATEGNNGGHQEGENDDCECTLGVIIEESRKARF